MTIRRKYTIGIIALGIFLFLVLPYLLIIRPLFTAEFSEEAAAIAVNYAAKEYGEEVTVDRAFLHGGFLSYLVSGHFHDRHSTEFEILVDDDNGQVKDFTFSKDYANMNMSKLNDQYKEQLEARNYRIPDRYISKIYDGFFVAYSCADIKDCRIKELQVAVSDTGGETEEEAFQYLYEWQQRQPRHYAVSVLPMLVSS